MLFPKSSPSIGVPKAEGPPRCCISPSFFYKHALMGDDIYKNMPLWDFLVSPSSSYDSSGAPGVLTNGVAAVTVIVVIGAVFPSSCLLSALFKNVEDGVGIKKDLQKALAFCFGQIHVV